MGVELQIVYLCPNSECGELFIAYFDMPGEAGMPEWRFRECRPTNFKPREFDNSINKCSPKFCEIYNEAQAAENLGLKNVCGVGYRKALEFLMKDYLIMQKPKEAEAIAKVQLGACIENYVSDQRLKIVAKRAAWLGNDETHYERRWPDLDVQSLKQMIDLTLHWIQMETLTDSALAAMPSPK